MIALCVPLATRFRRGGGLGMLFVVGVGLGFVYFVVDGIAADHGRTGLRHAMDRRLAAGCRFRRGGGCHDAAGRNRIAG